jgi:heme-degrading monooxygenase HmoA
VNGGASAPPFTLSGMVLEVAIFDIQAAHEEAFISAYGQARTLVTGTPGCLSTRMTRGIETPTRFVLLVEWSSVDAHQAFRDSERFPQWRALIGPHFNTPPQVEHYSDVVV